MQDSQRGKVYKAENSLDLKNEEFATLAECQRFIHSVVDSRRWKEMGGRRYVTVGYWGGKKATGGGGMIQLPNMNGKKRHLTQLRAVYFTRGEKIPPNLRKGVNHWAQSKIVLLHELTHNLADDQHGPKFCWAFLLLVREFMGRATYDLLLDAFGNNRVKMS